MQERGDMKLKALTIGVVAVSTVTFAVLNARRDDTAPTVTSAVVTRGAIVSAIVATGTVEPVKTVQVGSQVSGTVEALFADFNSIVRKGQVLARLEESIYASAIEQAQANVVKATAELERARVTADDAESKRKRTAELVERGLLPTNDLDNATLTRDV